MLENGVGGGGGGEELHADNHIDMKPSAEHLLQMGLGYPRKLQEGRYRLTENKKLRNIDRLTDR